MHFHHVRVHLFCSGIYLCQMYFALVLRWRRLLDQSLKRFAQIIPFAKTNSIALVRGRPPANGYHTVRCAHRLSVFVCILLAMPHVRLPSNRTVLRHIVPTITEILRILGRAVGMNVRTRQLAAATCPCKLHVVSVDCAPTITCLVSMLHSVVLPIFLQNPNAANSIYNHVAHSAMHLALMIPSVLVCAKSPLALIPPPLTMTDSVLSVSLATCLVLRIVVNFTRP